MISLLYFSIKLKSTDFVCDNLFSIYNQYLFHLFECSDRYTYITNKESITHFIFRCINAMPQILYIVFFLSIFFPSFYYFISSFLAQKIEKNHKCYF